MHGRNGETITKHEHCYMKYMQTGNTTTKWPEALQKRHYKLRPYNRTR